MKNLSRIAWVAEQNHRVNIHQITAPRIAPEHIRYRQYANR